MKALVCERWAHYSELTLRDDFPRPQLGSGQVRIAVKYATVGFVTTLVVQGKYQRKPPLPFAPGTEIAGHVLEVASDVTTFKPGDRVAAAVDWGGYGEEAVATVLTTWRVPDEVDLASAALVPLSYGTSYAALHWRAGLAHGQTLVVYGAAGGVGLTAVQLGRLAGAKVIAVAGSQERVDLAIAQGAHRGLVHGGDDLGRRIKALNDGRAVDVVYDPVGGDLFDEALRCVGVEGKIILIGFASGRIPQIPANLLLVKNIDVIGFNFGLYLGWGLTDERATYASRLAEMMQTIFAHMAAGELQPPASQTYSLENFVEAFDSIVSRKSTGRVVLQIGA